MKNYYDELEVSKTASKEVIGKVYKILAKKYNPDTTKEIDKQAAEEKFKIISEAYEVLSDDEKRKKYDIELEQSNPTISYQEYINVVNQRDTLNHALNNLKAQFYQNANSFNTNNSQYNGNNQSQYRQNQFNQTQYQQNQYRQPNANHNSGYNNQRPNMNQNQSNPNAKNTGKKYYYNTATGQPVSTFDYYKYRIRKFLSNIGFYILLIFVIIALIKNLLSFGVNDLLI